MITVTTLTYYPIKACRGIDTPVSNIEPMGLAGDRRMMVVTPEGGFLTQRDHPRLALVAPSLQDGSLTLSAPGVEPLGIELRTSGATVPVDIWGSKDVAAVDQGDLAAGWLSSWLNAPVRLVHLANGYIRRLNPAYAVSPHDHTAFADGYPILVTSEESLQDLNSRLDSPVPMNRFRPNLVVKGGQPFAEDGWRRVRIGDVELALVKPCPRCVVTTIDKDTLMQGKEPLKTLSAYRKTEMGALFGMNAIPVSTGRIEVGTPVEVLS